MITLSVAGVLLLAEFYFLMFGVGLPDNKLYLLLPIAVLAGLVLMAPISALLMHCMSVFIVAPIIGALVWSAESVQKLFAKRK